MLTQLTILLACSATPADSDTSDTTDTVDPGETDTQTDTDDPGSGVPTVTINEFMAINQTTIEDDAGAHSDWIELYNTGDEPVSLHGLYLTDEDDEPTQFALPSNQTIAAHGYALFWADAQPSQGEDHTTFKLSGTGEYVGLFFVAEGGSPVRVDAVQYGNQVADVSAARVPDGSLTWEQTSPTPGRTNGE